MPGSDEIAKQARRDVEMIIDAPSEEDLSRVVNQLRRKFEDRTAAHRTPILEPGVPANPFPPEPSKAVRGHYWICGGCGGRYALKEGERPRADQCKDHPGAAFTKGEPVWIEEDPTSDTGHVIPREPDSPREERIQELIAGGPLTIEAQRRLAGAIFDLEERIREIENGLLGNLEEMA